MLMMICAWDYYHFHVRITKEYGWSQKYQLDQPIFSLIEAKNSQNRDYVLYSYLNKLKMMQTRWNTIGRDGLRF